MVGAMAWICLGTEEFSAVDPNDEIGFTKAALLRSSGRYFFFELDDG